MDLLPSELKSALDRGIGDIIATAIVVSPEREKFVDFTIPFYTGAKKVVVTNANKLWGQLWVEDFGLRRSLDSDVIAFSRATFRGSRKPAYADSRPLEVSV